MTSTSNAVLALSLAFVAAISANANAAPKSQSLGSPQAAQTQQVDVIGTDYAYIVPKTIRAGHTEFQFENRGKQRHEIALVLARDGTTATEIAAAANAGLPAPRLAEAYAKGSTIGALFAAPGTRSSAGLVVDLSHGQTYVLVCTLRDTPQMPEHASMGMFHIIHVK
jgi:hypothetical protein